MTEPQSSSHSVYVRPKGQKSIADTEKTLTKPFNYGSSCSCFISLYNAFLYCPSTCATYYTAVLR